MTGALFELSFWLVLPAWTLMIFAPGWRWTERLAASPLTVLPVLTVYCVTALPVLPELWSMVSGPDVDTFRDFTALAGGAGAIWAQVLAWDLLVGQWMYREGRRLAVHPLLMGPLLALTILLSPFGLLVFLVVRAVRARARTAATQAGPAGPGTPATPARQKDPVSR